MNRWPNLDYWNRDIFDPVPEAGWEDVDRRLWLPSDDEIERLAHTINDAHTGQKNETKPWPADFRALGLYGERAFARVFGVRMDTAVRRYGSGRKNATLADGTTVDVMTRRLLRSKALPDLTRRVKGFRKLADVCCLILWIGRGWEPVFLGWLEEEAIKEGDVKAYQNGNPNYVVPVAKLRPMHELMARHRPESVLAQPETHTAKPELVTPKDVQLSFGDKVA